MTRITRILTVPISGGYYYDDLTALQGAHIPVQDRCSAKPITSGFKRVREPSEALSVGVVLDNGLIAWGDCVSVAYGAAAGRDPVFRSRSGQLIIRNQVEPVIAGKQISEFRALMEQIEDLEKQVEVERTLPARQPGEKISRRDLFKSASRMLSSEPDKEQVTVQQPLHTALRYGLSQALLKAVAIDQRVTVTELICREWNLQLPNKSTIIHAQCGVDRYRGAEKMIIRGIQSLPHSLIDNPDEQLGKDAVPLIRYVKWLRKRIRKLGAKGYQPTIHIDLHGGLGSIYQNNLGKILGTISALERAAGPYSLRIESPLVMGSREEQIQHLKTLREYLRFRKMKTQLVADEWADSLDDIKNHLDQNAADMIHIKMPDLGGIQNTIEAVMACQKAGIGTLLGGSCAETDLSARFSAELALAVQPDLILAKPGMGVDEGISIVANQMSRVLAQIEHSTSE